MVQHVSQVQWNPLVMSVFAPLECSIDIPRRTAKQLVEARSVINIYQCNARNLMKYL